MILSQTKIFRIKDKCEPIFFLPDHKKKLILILSLEESENEIFIDNLKKTTNVLGINFDQDVVLKGVPANEVFNWSGILDQNEPLTICFFGSNLSGIESLSTNATVKIGEHIVFQTFTMSEIVKEQNKKGEFWVNFKALFGK